MQIKTELMHRHGKKVSYGKDIVIEFDNDGVAEVAQEVAESIMERDTSLSIFDAKEVAKKQIVDNTEKTEQEIVENKEESKTGESESVEELEDKKEEESEKVDLSTMTVKELQAIATEAGLPEKEWQTLKKSELIKYLESKTGE